MGLDCEVKVEVTNMIELTTPINEEDVSRLQVGDTVEISGYILCGRDAVLPKVLKMIEEGTVGSLGIDLHGQVIFTRLLALQGWAQRLPTR